MKLHALRRILLESNWLGRRALGPFIRFSPAFIKYGTSYTHTRKLISKAEKSPEFVEGWIRQRLAKVLEETSTTEWGQSIGLKPSIGFKENPLELLSKLPAMRAKDVSDHPTSYLTSKLSDFDFCSTSGSSGKPKIFYLGKDRGPIETAFVHNAWSSSGFSHRSKRAVFRGISLEGSENPIISWRPELQELQISPFSLSPANLQIIWAEIQRRNIKYLHGYPSALEVLARWLTANQSDREKAKLIKGVFVISETTFAHQEILFRSVFTKAQVISFYGLSEKVAFAIVDKEDSSVFHFSPVYGVTELLDDDLKPVVESGRKGQLYSTGLLFSGTRFVRYETGDQAELVESPSRSNNYVLTVKNVESRWNARPAIGKNGESIALTSLNLHQPVMLYYNQMQFLQKRPGELQLSVIPNELSNTQNLDKLCLQMQTLVGNSLDVTVEVVASLEQNSRGKIPLLVVRTDP
jgi:phenylacetate-CoA ligase